MANKVFRRDKQERRGSGVVPYVRESFDCLEINGNDTVECLWVRIRGKANKADVMFMLGSWWVTPNQDEEADRIFCKYEL